MGEVEEIQETKEKLANPKVRVLILAVFIVAAGILAYYFREPLGITAEEVNTIVPTQSQDDEIQDDVVTLVGRHYALPSSVPTVAYINDLTIWKDQPFFERAKVGNVLLIYPDEKLIILYDPNIDKILNVAPVNFDTSLLRSGVVPTDEE